MNIDDILKKVDNLPPMPAVAVKLLEATNDPNIDMATVAEWISRDPGMTANLLRLCNSCFYGFSSEITSVRQAASLFGLRKLSQIALTALSSRYLTGEHPGYDLSPGELWRHSIIAATAAETIAIKAKYSNVGTAFTAGLLQDIGKIVIAEHVGAEKKRILEMVATGNIGFMDAEKEVLGFTHAEAGALLLKKWNFPAALSDSVLHHHESEKAEVDRELAEISQLADALTMTLGVGLGSDGLYYRLPDEVLHHLGFTKPEMLEDIMVTITKRIQEAPDLFAPPKGE